MQRANQWAAFLSIDVRGECFEKMDISAGNFCRALGLRI